MHPAVFLHTYGRNNALFVLVSLLIPAGDDKRVAFAWSGPFVREDMSGYVLFYVIADLSTRPSPFSLLAKLV
jgi:hypothetical protein